MKSKALLYVRKVDNCFEMIILDRANLLITLKVTDLPASHMARVAGELANSFEATLGPDISPQFGGPEMLTLLKRICPFNRFWKQPGTQYYGLWMNDLVKFNIWDEQNPDQLTWEKQLEHIGRWMLNEESEFCEDCKRHSEGMR